MLRLLIAHLRRHVAFVMLGEDRLGGEGLPLHSPLGDHAAAFPEQIGQDAAIGDRHLRLTVGHTEAHRHPIRRSAQRCTLDHTAQAHDPITGVRRLARSDVRRRVVEAIADGHGVIIGMLRMDANAQVSFAHHDASLAVEVNDGATLGCAESRGVGNASPKCVRRE